MGIKKKTKKSAATQLYKLCYRALIWQNSRFVIQYITKKFERRFLINKTELVAAVAESTGVSKKETAAVIDATFEKIAATIEEGDKVQLIGFGTFETRDRAAREGINPLTKEKIQVEACKVPAFKPGKALKENVNK